MKKLVPKHPRTTEFVAQDLYAVNSFKELEAKISALVTKDERGAAFEVFAEAFLVTPESIDPNHYWPHTMRQQLNSRAVGSGLCKCRLWAVGSEHDR